MTSLTMIVALGSLLIWGPEVIFGFTAAMLLGIFVGTYSSVYMAAPILVWAKVERHSFVPNETGPVAGAERMGASERLKQQCSNCVEILMGYGRSLTVFSDWAFPSSLSTREGVE